MYRCHLLRVLRSSSDDPFAGGVRERPNRHAWKACDLHGSVGSNPTSSATRFPNTSGSTQGCWEISGAFQGAKRGALERARLEDRREILRHLRAVRYREPAKWKSKEVFGIWDRAAQLPFLDRAEVCRMSDLPASYTAEMAHRKVEDAIEFFSHRVNPRFTSRWFLLKRRALLIRKGPYRTSELEGVENFRKAIDGMTS